MHGYGELHGEDWETVKTDFIKTWTYKGEFKEDKRSGYGSWIHSNGQKYKGQWLYDRKLKGEYTMPKCTITTVSSTFSLNKSEINDSIQIPEEGWTYKGEYKGDKRNGYG